MADELTVRNAPDRNRYEAVTPSGEIAGFSVYDLDGDTVTFLHTEVDPAFEGRGVGSAIAKGALDDVRASGLSVVPLCPFINAYIQRHQEYADLVKRPARPE